MPPIRILVMTNAEAAGIRGPSGELASLDPIPLKGGGYFLPASLRTHPSHVEAHAKLSALTERDLDPENDLITEA